MKKAIIAIVTVLAIFATAFAQKRDVKLTKPEKAAIAAYDDLPEEYRKKAVAHWFEAYKERQDAVKKFKGDKYHAKKLEYTLKNNPPLYPSIWDGSPSGDLVLKKGAWGEIDIEGTSGPGVYILQVLSDSKFILKVDDTTAIVDGVDVAGVADKTTMSFPGVFEVTGTESYTNAAGAKKTVYVVKPVEKVERDKSDSK